MELFDDDLIAGGSGDDIMEGGGGADIILGDSGIDVDLATRIVTIMTSGMPGQDDFEVPGGDVIHGGTGNDIILGDHGVINQNTISINPFNNILTIENANLAREPMMQSLEIRGRTFS